jgi:hypothetical protein
MPTSIPDVSFATDPFRRWIIAELKSSNAVRSAYGSPAVYASSFVEAARSGVHVDRIDATPRPGGVPSVIVETLLRCFHSGSREQANAAHAAVQAAVTRIPGGGGPWAVNPTDPVYGLHVGSARATSALDPERSGRGSTVWESVVRVRAIVAMARTAGP